MPNLGHGRWRWTYQYSSYTEPRRSLHAGHSAICSRSAIRLSQCQLAMRPTVHNPGAPSTHRCGLPPHLGSQHATFTRTTQLLVASIHHPCRRVAHNVTSAGAHLNLQPTDHSFHALSKVCAVSHNVHTDHSGTPSPAPASQHRPLCRARPTASTGAAVLHHSHPSLSHPLYHAHSSTLSQTLSRPAAVHRPATCAVPPSPGPHMLPSQALTCHPAVHLTCCPAAPPS